MPDRLTLANLPTPLEPYDRLSEVWGGPRIWVKRDDLTGFGLSGNKIRKIEFHAAAARKADADVLITAGAAQSNHCRATALAAARLGMRCELYLRTADGTAPNKAVGNHLLHRLAGANIHFITPHEYRNRDELMAQRAVQLAESSTVAWVIPEGASDFLGMQGFVAAGAELATQIAAWEGSPTVWHAASSGGTTAGLALAASDPKHDFTVTACSVGDHTREIRARLAEIWAEAGNHITLPDPLPDPIVTDAYVGGGYAVISDEELSAQLEATRLTGLLFDPVYTGKAIYGLREEIRAGAYDGVDDVVFWHTGGGFGVFAYDFGMMLEPPI